MKTQHKLDYITHRITERGRKVSIGSLWLSVVSSGENEKPKNPKTTRKIPHINQPTKVKPNQSTNQKPKEKYTPCPAPRQVIPESQERQVIQDTAEM